ncbi:unnamed protein product [Cylindrotheca closterium]|uniref:Uncharacterized protein n=1 Tax=Cylindrotheca closterium TaxID=2856 RepID=A0AAD2PUE6_9STRA|nr:unnamed protein product [Cylindrotheca closterium]
MNRQQFLDMNTSNSNEYFLQKHTFFLDQCNVDEDFEFPHDGLSTIEEENYNDLSLCDSVSSLDYLDGVDWCTDLNKVKNQGQRRRLGANLNLQPVPKVISGICDQDSTWGNKGSLSSQATLSTASLSISSFELSSSFGSISSLDSFTFVDAPELTSCVQEEATSPSANADKLQYEEADDEFLVDAQSFQGQELLRRQLERRIQEIDQAISKLKLAGPADK